MEEITTLDIGSLPEDVVLIPSPTPIQAHQSNLLSRAKVYTTLRQDIGRFDDTYSHD